MKTSQLLTAAVMICFFDSHIAHAKGSDSPIGEQEPAVPTFRMKIEGPRDAYELPRDYPLIVEQCENLLEYTNANHLKAMRLTAYADTLANALSSAIDTGELVMNGRCYWPVSKFDGFLKGDREKDHPGYFERNLSRLLLGENPFLTFNIKGPSPGETTSVRINCPRALEKKHPETFDVSDKTIESTVKEFIEKPLELKALLNRSLSGRMKTVNPEETFIQDIKVDSEDPTCLKIIAFSGKQQYGRNFRMCADSKKTTCGRYFGNKIDDILTRNDEKWEKDMRKWGKDPEPFKQKGEWYQ